MSLHGKCHDNAIAESFCQLLKIDRRLEGLVRRVRTKCLDEMGQALPLQTAYGFGYAFTDTLEILS